MCWHVGKAAGKNLCYDKSLWGISIQLAVIESAKLVADGTINLQMGKFQWLP